MKWTGLFIWACIINNAEACFEDGEFYCAKLWYFWFVVFFIFVFILIGAIITTNLCTKKKRRVGIRGNGRKSRRKPNNGKRKESRTSIISKPASDSTKNSPEVTSKDPTSSPAHTGDFVASKRYFNKKAEASNKTTFARDISTVENGDDEQSKNKDSILTARDLPTSLVIEEEETNLGKTDTIC